MYDDPSFSKFGVINILTSANLPLNQFSAAFKGRVADFDHGGEPAAATICVSMNVPSPSWLVWNSDTKVINILANLARCHLAPSSR
jgi:hypothetical protein